MLSIEEHMRKIKTLKILALGLLFVSSTVFSQIRYQASMDPGAKKLWSNQGNKLSCSLIFDIPAYGYANFMTYSGRILHSAMMLYPKLGIGQSSVMRFISTKPEWHSSSAETLLGKIDLFTGFDPYVGPTLHWKLLAELDHGNQILMPYTDNKLAAGQNIIPSISPLGFKEAYKKYLGCQEKLLRVNFSDIRLLPLVFKYQSDSLTAKSLALLKEQIEYINADQSISKITIRAYAYDLEQNIDNTNMAKDRAESIKNFYTESGIDEKIIEIVPFNTLTLNTKESNPIANEAVTARNALISLERDIAKINKDMEVIVPDVGAQTGDFN